MSYIIIKTIAIDNNKSSTNSFALQKSRVIDFHYIIININYHLSSTIHHQIHKQIIIFGIDADKALVYQWMC